MKVSNCKPAAPGRYNQTAITEVAEATNVKEHKTKKGSRTLTIREASKYFFFVPPRPQNHSGGGMTPLQKATTMFLAAQP